MEKISISKTDFKNISGGMVYLFTALDVEDNQTKGVILTCAHEGDFYGVIVNAEKFKAFGLKPGNEWREKAATLEVKDEPEVFEDFQQLFKKHPWAHKSLSFIK